MGWMMVEALPALLAALVTFATLGRPTAQPRPSPAGRAGGAASARVLLEASGRWLTECLERELAPGRTGARPLAP